MTRIFGWTLASTVLLCAACSETAPEASPEAGRESSRQAVAGLPAFITYEDAPQSFDGQADDLLTGGLGLAGLRSPLPPLGGSLRSMAIHTNFRGIVDLAPGGGFTDVYGPAEEALKVPGTEYRALATLPDQVNPFAIAVLVPDAFETERPCLVVGPSSGSRGLYGAIGSAGAWGLTRGCAVALTDKSTGTGFYHLDTGEGYGLDLSLGTGERRSLIYAPSPSGALTAYKESNPHRIAVKHAHSGDNVEKDWGRTVLYAARYGLYALTRHFADDDTAGPFTSDTVEVIAASVSNGGNAVIRAAEQDTDGILDAVVASEPNITPAGMKGARVSFGGEMVSGAGRSLLDYGTFMNIYAPCAAQAPELAGLPFAAVSAGNAEAAAAWCASLADAGLVAGAGTATQAADALAQIRDFGFLPETDASLHVMEAFKLWPAVAAGYVSAYGRSSVIDEVCGLSYALTGGGGPREAMPADKANMAALSAGIPPTAGVNILLNGSLGGDWLSAARCLRSLAEGNGDGGAKVREGLTEVLAIAETPDIPVILLHGRADALVPATHASQAYTAAHLAGGPSGSLRYYEVEHAQHFDAFLALPDFAPRFVPLHAHFDRALDLVWAHLRDGAGLPPSQVVRSRPRGPGAPPLTAENLGDILAEPGENTILFADGVLRVPK